MNDQNLPLLNEDITNAKQSLEINTTTNPLNIDGKFVSNDFNIQNLNSKTQKLVLMTIPNKPV